MTITKPVPCIPEEGIHAQIPGAAVAMKSFVDAYHRLGGDPEILRIGFQLEAWQFHAAMAYYLAHQKEFDAEYERMEKIRQQYYEASLVKKGEPNGWAQLYGALPDEESDEEINAALERMS